MGVLPPQQNTQIVSDHLRDMRLVSQEIGHWVYIYSNVRYAEILPLKALVATA